MSQLQHTHTSNDLDKFRASHCQERDLRLCGNCLCQQRFSTAWRSKQQSPLWYLGAQQEVSFRILNKR